MSDSQELINLQGAIAELKAGYSYDISQAGKATHVSKDDHAAFEMPERPWDDRVKGEDPLSLIDECFPHLFYSRSDGPFYKINRCDITGKYLPATTLSIRSFCVKLLTFCEVVALRDESTGDIVGSKRRRPFATDMPFIFFLYKRLMFLQLTSISFQLQKTALHSEKARDMFPEIITLEETTHETLQETFRELEKQNSRGSRRQTRCVDQRQHPASKIVEKLLKQLDGYGELTKPFKLTTTNILPDVFDRVSIEWYSHG